MNPCPPRPEAPRILRHLQPALLLAMLLAPVAAIAADSRMTGRVIDSDRQTPIAGADVELANAANGQGFFHARTNARGEFSLERIAPERWYNLTVSAPGYADFVLGNWQFPSAQRAVDVVVPLDRAGTLQVTLTGGDGRTPIAGAKVTVRSERAAEWWRGFRPPPAPAFTDRAGAVSFVDLEAGYWTVQAEASGLVSYEGRRIAVRRGEKTAITARLLKPASISGFVRLADGTGVPNLTVIARGPAEGVGTTAADGSFTVGELPPGRYRLDVNHEGFESAALAEPIVLREGESRGVGAIAGAIAGVMLAVRPKPAEFAFVMGREAFGLDAPIKIGLRSFRVGTVDLTLFEIPTARLLDSRNDFRKLTGSVDTTGLARAESWSHATPEGAPFTWREEELTLPQAILPGAYVLRGRAGALERRVILFVTDLSLLVKRSPARVLIEAASLKNGAPVRGASISIATVQQMNGPRSWADAIPNAASPRGVTDERGLLEVAGTGTSPWLRVVGVSESNGVSVADIPIAAAATQRGDQSFLYTDRPIYRPSQTVYWKLFARRADGTSYALPDAGNVSVSLSGPDGASVPAPSASLSRHGSSDGAITLPADLPLGDWTLTASTGFVSSQATLAIQQYRKPEFRVDVTPDHEVYVNGDEVRFAVAASYFFGAPVFGARVRYNLFETRLTPAGNESSGDEDFDFEDDEGAEGAGAGFGRVIKSGETRTDVDGRVALSFTPPSVTYDRRLTLEAEVVDAASRAVSARGSAVVGRGLFAMTIAPVSRLVDAGQPIQVDVRTLDHSGKPVSAAVTVSLDQDVWNPLERRYTRSTRPLATITLTTNREGRARASLAPTPARSGSIQIHARADDARGNRIDANSSVWVFDARISEYPYRYPTLEVFPDRQRYRPGDTLRVLVNTDVANARVLATLEGRDILATREAALAGHTGLVSFVLPADIGTSAFVSIHVRKGKEVQSRTLEIPVEGGRHDLKIALTPDHDQYRPGEEAKIAVETRDATGRPVPAEVSVGVVDEAIYSLRPDATRDPHEVFYGRRPNWVTTVMSFPTLYYGGVNKGGQEEPRKDFRDVALWAPRVETSAEGRAEVSLKWPDNLTTWRITSRGATDSTLVGRAVAKTRVTKPLVARLATPRFFVAGDAAQLVSIVNNRTAQPLPGVEESMAAAGVVKLAGKPTRKADLTPNGELREEWPVEVARELPANADSARGTFTFRASAPSDRDALELSVPVVARAVALRPHGAGRVDGATVSVNAGLPANLVRAGSEVWIDLSPSPAAMSLSAIEYLDGFPYACTEQSSNAILPAVALLNAAKHAGVVVPGWGDPAVRLASAINRLLANQGNEGGWGWWREAPADPYLTVLAIDALARVTLAGFASPAVDGALMRGVAQVPRLLDEVRSEDGEAYALAHLTAVLQLPESQQRWPELRARLEDLALAVAGGRGHMGVAGLALSARGLADLGRAAESKAALDALIARAVSDGGGTHWPGDAADEQSWLGDDQENTAYALSALVGAAPADARLPEIVRWLASNRHGPAWRSTRSTGPVAVALAEYLAARPNEMKPEYRLKVEWNGRAVLERTVTAADLFGGGAFRARVPGTDLKPGDNRLTVSKQGTGAVYWSWQARALVPSPGPETSSEKRLQLTREYFHAERTADRRGRPRWLTSPLVPGEPFKVGESILVRLTLHAPHGLSWLLLEDPLVAGVEIDQTQPEGADWPWDTHAEARDDHAAFFLNSIGEGETVLEYLVRPEMAGAMTALPASAGAMYDPDLLVRSTEAKVAVAPR